MGTKNGVHPPTQIKETGGRNRDRSKNLEKHGLASARGDSKQSRESQREIRRIDREEKDAELDAKIAQMMQQVEGLRAEKTLLKKQQECDDKRSEIEETQSHQIPSRPLKNF